MCLFCVFSSPPWEFLGLYTVIYEWPPFRCPGLRLSGGLFSNLWGMPFGTRPSSRLAGGAHWLPYWFFWAVHGAVAAGRVRILSWGTWFLLALGLFPRCIRD